MIAMVLSGVRKAASRPSVLIGVWLANLLIALPAAWVVAAALENSFGTSLAANDLREGFSMAWYGEYSADAAGVAGTFSPDRSGVGAFLINLEGWATGALFRNFGGLIGLGLVWALVWALLLGGVLTRYATAAGEPAQQGFFEAGGRYFPRFVRLTLFALPLYGLIYWGYRSSLRWLAEFTRDVTRESTVLLYSLVLVLLTALLLVVVRTCFDYAKIATVLEGRRSMFVAALRGILFVVANPLRTMGLYLAFALLSAVLLAVYAWVAPGATTATAFAVWFGFAIGQAFLLTRLFLRLSLLAGEMALYRNLTANVSRPAASTAEAADAL